MLYLPLAFFEIITFIKYYLTLYLHFFDLENNFQFNKFFISRKNIQGRLIWLSKRNKIETGILYLSFLLVLALGFAVYYLGTELADTTKEITKTSLACNASHEDTCAYALKLSEAVDLNKFDFINVVLSILVIFIAISGVFSFIYIHKLAKTAAEDATKLHLKENCRLMLKEWLETEPGKSVINDVISQNISDNNDMRKQAVESIINDVTPDDADNIANNLDDLENKE